MNKNQVKQYDLLFLVNKQPVQNKIIWFSSHKTCLLNVASFFTQYVNVEQGFPFGFS